MILRSFLKYAFILFCFILIPLMDCQVVVKPVKSIDSIDSAVIWSTDIYGDSILYGTDMGSIHHLNLTTYLNIRSFRGHGDAVWCVRAVGSSLFSASADGTIIQWIIETGKTGKTERTLFRGSSEIASLSIMGTSIFAARFDGNVSQHNFQTESDMQTFSGHKDQVWGLSSSPSYLFSTSLDNTTRQWDPKSGKQIRTFDNHAQSGCVLALNDTVVFSGLENGTIAEWDVVSGRLIRSLNGHKGGVRALAVVNNTYLLSGSTDSNSILWSIENGTVLKVFEGHTGHVNSITVLNTTTFLTGSSDHTLKFWSLDTQSSASDASKRSSSAYGDSESSIQQKTWMIVGLVATCLIGVCLIFFGMMYAFKQKLSPPKRKCGHAALIRELSALNSAESHTQSASQSRDMGTPPTGSIEISSQHQLSSQSQFIRHDSMGQTQFVNIVHIYDPSPPPEYEDPMAGHTDGHEQDPVSSAPSISSGGANPSAAESSRSGKVADVGSSSD